MESLEKLAKRVRKLILESTTAAGSGHPTSSLSATDLLTVLFFGDILRFDLSNPDLPTNDRFLLSKGHASPVFYALYTVAGAITKEELLTLRKFTSKLEGHPTRDFAFTELPTGSLGQGLSAAVGMAINAKYIDKTNYKTYVLLGDSEMAEGSNWEAIQLAMHYKLDTLIAILDVNRLGQRGQTMYGHDPEAYRVRVSAFGWETIVIDGHNLAEIQEAYKKALSVHDKPVMIIAKTLKGKGISFLEDKEGWHGKALKPEELESALKELGDVDDSVQGVIATPPAQTPETKAAVAVEPPRYENKPVATRKAYGNALVRLLPAFPTMVVLDAEVSNSTYAESVKEKYPDHFFEMYIAEQNMVGVGLGLARRGKLPFVSSFAAFLSRAADQFRMAQYAHVHLVCCGSHAGVSIGEDGASQMGLEDIAMFRSLLGSTVLYPSDAYAAEHLVEAAAKHTGIVYIRTTRKELPLLYGPEETFPIGGSKTLLSSETDHITIVSAGITLYEALTAAKQLKDEGVNARVIDLYSVKPLDLETLKKAAKDTKILLTVEDHHREGGIGEAVASALSRFSVDVHHLAVDKMPRSGKPDELLFYEGIDSNSIVKTVKHILKTEEQPLEKK